MDERARRVGENEALFRSVNEQVRGLNEAFLVGDTLRIVCECGEQSCVEQVDIEPAAYEALRADSRLFAGKPGHEEPDLETVVVRHEGYFIVRKEKGEAEEIAR